MRIRLILSLALLALATLAWRPIRLPCIEHLRAASVPEATENAVALLVVNDAAVTEQNSGVAASFGDGSYAWWSALEEEFGATAFLEPNSLRENGIPASASVAVFSSSARADLAALRSLLAWVEAGHLLLVDTLTSATADHLGISLDECATDSLPVRLRAADVDLDHLQLHLPAHSLEELPARARRLLFAADCTLAAAWPIGAGAVIVCAFDLGRMQGELRQGRTDAAVSHRWLPRADLLVRQVLHGAQSFLPLPRLSPLPAGAEGLYVLSFDEDSLGDAAAALVEASARQGLPHSFFVSAQGMSEATLRRLRVGGSDLGLSWDNVAPRPHQEFGLGPWRPLWRELPLHAQRAKLARQLDATAPLCVRSAELPVADPWRHFRILEASRIALDSSLGPQLTQLGWLHETARPFHPLDRNGRPFQFLELPFAFRSDGRYHPHAEERLLRDSQREHRGVVVASFRAGTMRIDPSVHRMRGLLAAGERASQLGHPVWSLTQYLEFRRARLRSELTRRRGGWQIRIDGPSLALELPAAAGLDSVRLDRRMVALAPPHRTGWHVLPLSAGEHDLEWDLP